MNLEDRLRALLRSEASTQVPAGDGLAIIQQRLVRRRRRRVLLLPSAALATATAMSAFFLLGGSSGTQKLVQTPATHGPVQPTSAASCRPTPGPCGTPTPASDTPSIGQVRALWPFTTDAEATAWQADHGDKPWAGDVLAVIQHFAADYLGARGLTAFQPPGGPNANGGTTVLLMSHGRQVAAARWLRLGQGRVRPVSVTEVTNNDMSVTAPQPMSGINSPTSVTGRLTGVDENVRLRLLTSAGKEIATAGAPAGSAVPWQGSLSWSDKGWATAGIVATTYSAKDGSLSRLVVVPVVRATGATANGESFVALANGHVNLYESRTGQLLRQLTYPPPGAQDTGAAWNGSTLIWVRSRPTGCADELDRLDAGSASTLVPTGTAHLGTPRLSPDGSTYAYLSTPCQGGAATVAVRAGGSARRTIAVRVNTTEVADVRDDGTVLVNERSGSDYRYLVVVVPTVGSVTQGTTLAVPAACTTIGGAFDGSTPVTWESCADGVRIARFSASGARTGAGPLLPTKAYAEDVSVRDGVVLAWLYDGSQLGRIVRAQAARLVVLVSNAGCTAVPEPTGCARAPSW